MLIISWFVIAYIVDIVPEELAVGPCGERYQRRQDVA